MTIGQRRSPGTVGLGALMLGLLTTPWAYVSFGALFAYPTSFVVVVTPLLTVATLYLLRRSFVPFRGFERMRLVGMAVSAAVLLTTLWYLTDFVLLTLVARGGLFALVWLGTSLFWLFVSLPFRAFGPEARLCSLLTSPTRQHVALATALLLFAVLSVFAWHYLTTPMQFIGGPTAPEIG